MDLLKENGIFYGTSITVTTDNIETVVSDTYIDELKNNGSKIIFYVEYVPVTDLNDSTAPRDKERELLDERLKVLKENNEGMLFLPFPGDEKRKLEDVLQQEEDSST